MIVKILLGLIGLGIVIFVHELGHFLAALAVGIDVEAFSIGWGPALAKKKFRGVEFRLGTLPIGGYCRMRGEEEFKASLSGKDAPVPNEKGTFFGAGPWRRIIVSFSGPAANVLFSVIVLALVWGIGFTTTTLGNRIILASEYDSQSAYAADEAGLATGDRIVAIDGHEVSNYQEIQETLAPAADRKLSLTVERNGTTFTTSVTPKLDRETGAGKIGVYFWSDPLIGSVADGSPAALAGLQSGDRIVSVDGQAIPHSIAFIKAFDSKPKRATVRYERDGQLREATILVSYGEDGTYDLGIRFKALEYRTPPLTPLAAIGKGASETWKTMVFSVSGLATLFKGVDLTKAVSGPVRLTYMVGEVAQEGFGQGIAEGLISIAGFLSLLSVALFVMNLLPIPALDGGMIVLFLVEGLRRRPLKAKTFLAFQTVGSAIIFSLLLFSLFGDILFLIHR